MKKIILATLVTLAVILGASSSQTLAGCGGTSDGRWKNWTDISSCVASVCGTNQGTKNQERICEFHDGSNECGSYVESYQYSDPTCPNHYQYQNNGNWNERCHYTPANQRPWGAPEHVAPSCPWGYFQVDDTCRKTVRTWEASAKQTRAVDCNNAPVIACPASPSPEPEMSPSPEPELSPSPEPSVSPEASPSPNPESSPEPGTKISFSGSGPDCSNSFHVEYKVEVDGVGQKDITVKFSYKADEKTAKTNSDGIAGMDFEYKGNGDVTAKSEGYENRTISIQAKENCPAVGGTPEVLGASTTQSGSTVEGEVLGASTLAETGVFEESLMTLLFTLGSGLIGLGIKSYAKKN